MERRASTTPTSLPPTTPTRSPTSPDGWPNHTSLADGWPSHTIYMGRSNNPHYKYLVLLSPAHHHATRDRRYGDTTTIHFGNRHTPNFTHTHDYAAKIQYHNKHPHLNNIHDTTLWTNPHFWERWILWNKTSKTKSIQYLLHNNITILTLTAIYTWTTKIMN